MRRKLWSLTHSLTDNLCRHMRRRCAVGLDGSVLVYTYICFTKSNSQPAICISWRQCINFLKSYTS
uniref:Uncharacterized protein n=1 Tax=Anguilla anguilla TaxID=7936 RepID=A0A0E9V3F8_ANGAN